MNENLLQTPTFRGEPIDNLQLMEDCTPLLCDRLAIERQLRENGYVYLPGYLGRERVIDARRIFIGELQKRGALDSSHDPMEGILNGATNPPSFAGGRLEELFTDQFKPIHDVLYAGPMMAFFRMLFDGADVLHYDFTWTRQVKPGPSTDIHSDVVYMGRGTHDLFTAWTPMGDNGFDLGGLIVLEGSNRHAGLAKAYWKSDVDTFCENQEDKRDAWQKGTNGSLKGNANQIRRSLGGKRWLTADYRMGDVVIFNVYTVHGGADNRSNKIRLSTDTRYQRADQTADKRWIGEQPAGHGAGGKIGRIC